MQRVAYEMHVERQYRYYIPMVSKLFTRDQRQLFLYSNFTEYTILVNIIYPMCHKF